MATLVGRWKFDEGSGTTANDSSGNGNAGTLKNSPTWVPGGGITFASASSQYVNIGQPSVLDLTGAFSISLWIKPTSYSGSIDTLVSKGYDGTREQYYFQFTSSTDLRFGWYNGSDIVADWTTQDIGTGTLKHVCGTWDGTTYLLYRNATQVASNTNSTARTHAAKDVNIAASQINASVSRFFNGTIQDVQIYNGALSSTDVTNIYNAGPGGTVGAATTLAYFGQSEHMLQHVPYIQIPQTYEPTFASIPNATPDRLTSYRQAEDILRHPPYLHTPQTLRPAFASIPNPTPVNFWWKQPDDLLHHAPHLDTNEPQLTFAAQQSRATQVLDFYWSQPPDLLYHPSTIDTRQQYQINSVGWEPNIFWWKQAPDLFKPAPAIETRQQYQLNSVGWTISQDLGFWRQGENLLRTPQLIESRQSYQINSVGWEPTNFWWSQPPDLLFHPTFVETRQPFDCSPPQATNLTPGSLGYWFQPPDLLRHAPELWVNEPYLPPFPSFPGAEPELFWWKQPDDLLRHAPYMETRQSYLTAVRLTPSQMWWKQPPNLLRHPTFLETRQPYLFNPTGLEPSQDLGWFRQGEDLLKHPRFVDTNQPYLVQSSLTIFAITPNTFWWKQPPDLLRRPKFIDTNQPYRVNANLVIFAMTPNTWWWEQPPALLRHPTYLETNQPQRVSQEFAILDLFGFWQQPLSLVRHPAQLDTNEPIIRYEDKLEPTKFGFWKQAPTLLRHPNTLFPQQSVVQEFRTTGLLWWRQPLDLLRHPTVQNETQEYFLGQGRLPVKPNVYWLAKQPDLLRHPPTLFPQQYVAQEFRTTDLMWWMQAPDLLRHPKTKTQTYEYLSRATVPITPNVLWLPRLPDLLRHPTKLDTRQPHQVWTIGWKPDTLWWSQPPTLLNTQRLSLLGGIRPTRIPARTGYGLLAQGQKRFTIGKKPALSLAGALRRSLIARATRTVSRAPDLQPPIVPGEQQFVTFDFGQALSGSSHIVSVTNIIVTVISGVDPTPAARQLDDPTLVNSPSSGVGAGAVSVLFGNMIGGVTYLLQCLVATSDGQELSIETHWLCQTPS